MPVWEVENSRELLISNGLSTMGFALPAAIAAGLVHADRRVIFLTGDGGFGMVLAELETLARLGLPVTVVVLNDSALSLIAIKQRPTGHGGSGAVRYKPIDFEAVAGGFGIPAWAAQTRTAFSGALEKALTIPGPSLIDARVDPRSYGEILRATRE